MAAQKGLKDLSDYRYGALRKNQIRLVRLLPGEPNDPIVVELKRETLHRHSQPLYEALSYAWGSRDNSVFIQIKRGNRQIGGRPWKRVRLDAGAAAKTFKLPITGNLEEALRYLRYTNLPRTLWIDAISIDQSNTEERSAEVLRMGDIYRFANRVIVWLGASISCTEDAMRVIADIGRNYTLEFDYAGESLRTIDPKAEVEQRMKLCFECCYSTQIKAGIEDLLRRPWFDRLWIWQELCKAGSATVVCGHSQMSWSIFSTAVAYLDLQIERVQSEREHDHGVKLAKRTNAKNAATAATIINLSRCAYTCSLGEGTSGLSSLLIDTQHSLCEDPRDRIYSLISMLPKGFRKRFKPDYRKSMCQIYTDAFLQCSTEYRDLDLLVQCGERQSDNGLPTWVPNWSAPRYLARLGRGPFYASGPFRSEIHIEPESMLCAKGLQKGSIKTVSEQVPLNSDLDTIKRIWNSCMPVSSGSSTSLTGIKAFDAHCATLVCGELRDRYPNEDGYLSLGEAIFLLEPSQPTLGDAVPGSNRGILDERFIRYQNDAVAYTGGRRFFTTVEGYVGLGPAEMRCSDIVCIFLGLKMPIVLRAIGQDRFQVIGCCYCHGLMDGEALLGPILAPWHVEHRSDVPMDITGVPRPYFLKPFETIPDEIERTQEDPRLWNLPPGWRSLWDKGGYAAWYKNKNRPFSRRLILPDPRLTSEELIEHGVEIETFQLV